MAQIVLSSSRLIKILLTRQINEKSLLSARSFCGPIRDWKPGPKPTTKEEMEAAAKKYNLIPEDYETYPDDYGLGDYPKLEPVGWQARDPFESYDHPYWRRNYGETLNIDHEAYDGDKYDPNKKFRYSRLVMFLYSISPVLFIGLLLYLNDKYDIRINQCRKPKQWPGPGKVHYTFEPEHD